MKPVHRFKSLSVMVALALVAILPAVTALAVGSQTASAQNATADAAATLRVLQASPDAPALDVLVNGQPFASNLAFGTATQYAPLQPDKYTIQIVPHGQTGDNALVKQDVSLDSGKAYILEIKNPLNKIDIDVHEVNLDAVDPGQARVRVTNASPDAGKLDVAVTGGDTWFSGVDSGDTTDYKQVDAGVYSLDLKGDNDTVLYNAANLEINDGRVYDIYAIGQVSDKTLTLVPLVTNVSQPCSQVLGIANANSSDACVRVVHASPGSGAMDLYVNGTKAQANLAYGTATDYIAVSTSDSAKIQLTAVGATPDNAAIDKNFTFDPGQAYQIIATGTQDDLQATEMEVDLTPLPTGQARVRLVQASPDLGKVDLSADSGDNIFTSVDFRDATEYKVVDAKDYTLELHKAGDSSVLTQVKVTFDEATTYDVIVIGQSSDSSLKLIVLSSKAEVRVGGVSTPVAGGTPTQAGTVTSDATPAGTPTVPNS